LIGGFFWANAIDVREGGCGNEDAINALEKLTRILTNGQLAESAKLVKQ